MAGQTLAQKILARASAAKSVSPGELITCKVDRVMATDITAALSIEVFRKMGGTRLFDPDACIFINDHLVPAKDIASADLARTMREFAKEQGIKAYFEVGRSGICHALVVEKALVRPGEVMVGADSHTCTAGVLGAFATGVGSTDLAAAWALGEIWFRVPETIRVNLTGALPPFVTAKDIVLSLVGRLGVDGARYKALEFGGDLLGTMSVEARLPLCNMAIEAGAKAGMVPCDDVTAAYVEARGGSVSQALLPDPDAVYDQVLAIDVDGMEPQVAEPFMPSNVRGVSAYAGVKVDQVFLGSCTNGYLEDLRTAAAILKGRQVAPGVRLIVTPATQGVYLSAVREGIIADLVEAGAAVTTPTCGACMGGHSGVLGDGEVALATTNRNFRGRMGATSSRVFLANPAVAAATAVTGTITHPGELP